MSAIGLVSAAVNLKTAGALGKVQLAVAGRMLKIASQQGDIALKLIEAATESTSSGWDLGSTRSQACRTKPSGPMR